MKLLAFDTSSKILSVAILEDETLLAQASLHLKNNHSKTLMPTIDFLMTSLALKPTDLDRIVVAQGPGSYTGLRIAVATAKTLAYTLKIDLVGVSSLLSLVPAKLTGLVIPLIDARRNNVYAGFYENGKVLQPEAYLSFEQVLEVAKNAKDVTFVGEVAAFIPQIEQALSNAKYQETLPDAVQLGRLGLNKQAVSLHDFVPNYLKRVEAEENWLKDHKESNQSYIKRL